jgi:hypothetical protein
MAETPKTPPTPSEPKEQFAPQGTPKPVDPNKPTQLPAPDPKDKVKVELHGKLRDILKTYGGNESNIPINHEYWQLVNQYRGQ